MQATFTSTEDNTIKNAVKCYIAKLCKTILSDTVWNLYYQTFMPG